MATVSFAMPDLGEGLTETEVLEWYVSVGDEVTLNQPIVQVESVKAVVELPSPHAGRIVSLHADPGAVVLVGTPIVTFDIGGEPDAPAAPVADSAEQPNLVGYGAKADAGVARRARRAAPSVTEPATAPSVTEPATAPTERPRSTPPVRKLARDLGIDLATLTGTGERGLITRSDVTSAAAAPSSAAAAPEIATVTSASLTTRTPIKSMRKHTAAAMVASAFTAPHATTFLTIDITPTMELIAHLKAQRSWNGLKLTPLTLAAKAVCIALGHHPTLNTHWDDAAQEIVQYHYVNLGFAAATPRGLMVPHVKNAERLSLRELAAAIADLADAARSGATPTENLSGGTMSITNVGVFGVDAGTPILNPGEAAILALGAVRKTPWEHQGGIALRQVTTLSLSFDHRLVDGEQGAKFLAEVGQILADPASLITLI